MLTLESFTPRTMSQYTVACPTKCSREQIAGFIYMNVAQNFCDSTEAFKSHFETQSSLVPMSLCSLPEIVCLWAGEFFVDRLHNIKHLPR